MRNSMTRPAAAAMAGLLVLFSAASTAQNLERSTAIASSDVLSQISMFNFREGGRRSDLLLRPTPIVRTGDGSVRVRYRNDNAEISVEVRRLPAPTSFGPYTAYVLWALTPDGRAANMGVLTGVDGGGGSIETQYGAPQFALIVTAEPHFAVSAPSTMVVLYNVPENVRGDESRVTSLTERADYATLTPIEIDPRTRPVEVVQAEYAVAIARAAGAEQYASRLFATAEERLLAARTAGSASRRAERREAPGLARVAVIAGEDARRAAMIARADAEADARRDAAAAAAARAERERADAEAAEARVAAEAAAEAAARAAEARAAEAARADLLNRLNNVLPTRQSPRGLVSEIGGVQFATGTANLNVPARESLARFSGIVASYPDLAFVIEGHTDSTGSDATNNELSLQRALAVRDYLIGQGVSASRIDVAGYGSSRPVGDNSTTQGRARNRRVEIVISGGLLAAGR
jgi:outer membrane protein OmpA-like peptidoglycan-associated protein